MSPTPKMAASVIAGAITVLIVWGLKQYAHTEIPGEAASAMTTVISFVAGYFAPKSGDA